MPKTSEKVKIHHILVGINDFGSFLAKFTQKYA